VPAKNSMELRLPMNELCLIRAGGPDPEDNFHFRFGEEVFHATDFLVVNPEGLFRTGDGVDNTDYFAFGKDVVAAASGEAAVVVDGVPDNPPGSVNHEIVPGNMILIKHEENQFSVYGHLKRGSTRIKKGDKVLSGQVIGQCGNSGYSSGPHLHFQMTNTEIFQDSTGFPYAFTGVDIIQNNRVKHSDQYVPKKNDVVRHAENPAKKR